MTATVFSAGYVSQEFRTGHNRDPDKKADHQRQRGKTHAFLVDPESADAVYLLVLRHDLRNW
jgi:hypothetical protein